MLIKEVSPDTIEGSWSNDLVISKLWLIRRLKKLQPKYGVIYILGSWYGNLSLLMLQKNLQFNHIINVDVDNNALRKSDEMSRMLGMSDTVTTMHKDANTLDYRQLDTDGLVINTSVNNIENRGWFENIPSGSMVALQSRDNDPNAINKYSSLDEFVNAYPMSKVLFKGTMKLTDPETKYNRYMLIGIK